MYSFHKEDQQRIIDSITNLGFVVVQDIYTPAEMKAVEGELGEAIRKEAAFHGTTDYKDYGMLLACPMYGGKFVEVLENNHLWMPFNALLGDSCITYVYTSSSMPPNGSNYSKRIHVDRPHYNPNVLESLGCLICVNDFSIESGGTWVLPYSHLKVDEPSEAYFYKHAFQIEAKAGSVFYFSLRLWHAGGENKTAHWRNALGIGMIRPIFKQRIDLPKAIPAAVAAQLSDKAKQKLGYFAQAPASLEEYYAPKETRAYREKSEWD